MLRKITLVLTFFLSFSALYSQDYDKRLLLKYTEQEILKIKTEDPGEYKFLINALDRGMFIAEIPTQKGKDVKFNGTIQLDLNKTHTFLSIGKEITKSYQYYKIEGTEKMLVIQPRIFLDERVLKTKK